MHHREAKSVPAAHTTAAMTHLLLLLSASVAKRSGRFPLHLAPYAPKNFQTVKAIEAGGSILGPDLDTSLLPWLPSSIIVL